MKKPASGWLHDDAALMNGDGVYYPVKVCVHAVQLISRKSISSEIISICCCFSFIFIITNTTNKNIIAIGFMTEARLLLTKSSSTLLLSP